ncbi:MAG: DUF2938 domain-containing protein [Thermoanaerobaculia bacterium]
MDFQFVVGVAVVGVGATLVMDLWNLFLKVAFGIPSLDLCLLGRWVGHMPAGTFRHERIAAAAPKAGECLVGRVVHYGIGVGLAAALAVLTSGDCLLRPTLLPAVLFGLVTVVFPFFVMQPALGLGIASARTSDPTRARLKSLASHVAFGIGLYVVALPVGSSVLAHP